VHRPLTFTSRQRRRGRPLKRFHDSSSDDDEDDDDDDDEDDDGDDSSDDEDKQPSSNRKRIKTSDGNELVIEHQAAESGTPECPSSRKSVSKNELKLPLVNGNSEQRPVSKDAPSSQSKQASAQPKGSRKSGTFPGRKCNNCQTEETSIWRKGPNEEYLCNGKMPD